MEICIQSLKNNFQYVDTVVEWLYSEWGDDNRNYWNSWVRSSLSDSDIPQCFICMVDGNIAGTYSLWRCDLQSRQDLFPWFGGLYVCNEYRGRVFENSKLGVIMQRHAIDYLRKLGYKKVYLFTEKDPAYYLYNNWNYIGKIPDEKDKYVSLCSFDVQA